MYRQIFNASVLTFLLTIYLPMVAGAQPSVSPNRILSCQPNLAKENVSFATSLATPLAAPAIYYRQAANGETILFADFAYVTYPFPHQVLTIKNAGSQANNSSYPASSENAAEANKHIDWLGFEQLHTAPPIFRITAQAKNPVALKNISFQADYGSFTISWSKQPRAVKPEEPPQDSAESERLILRSNVGEHLEAPLPAKLPEKLTAAPAYHLLFTTASLTTDKHIAGLTVVLDAGHGGSDPGAQREGIQEKQITLAIVNTLKKFLEEEGIKVLLTRSDDNFVSLEDRVKIANSIEPDLFLSVHINAMQNDPDVHGVETYYKTPQSRVLAESIHDSLVGYLGIPDRLVRKARFYVINHTAVPAVLAEVGFISSEQERERLISSDYQDRVAAALEHGVILYLAKAKEVAQNNEE
jgi:N-acetylmuramoyl-L-alanine amidase